MSLEAIKQVAEVEQATREQKTAAIAEAGRTVAEAERTGKSRLEEARAQAELQSRSFMKDAEDKAASHAAQVMEATEKNCVVLREKAEGRMAEAAALITRRVVNH